MKRIIVESKHKHFIGSWNIENKDLCKEIINFFEDNMDLQEKGQTGSGLNLSVKNTTDIHISPNDIKNPRFKCLSSYIGELHKCFIDYQEQWPFLKTLIQSVDVGGFNIQKYTSGGHFAKIHTEKFSIGTLHRVFAWMIYLNDVDDGGETNFLHYDLKVKPETGKILIWPAEWTHAHSGEILNSGFKYIVTGWMHLPYKEKK